jgi:hypothetical protein
MNERKPHESQEDLGGGKRKSGGFWNTEKIESSVVHWLQSHEEVRLTASALKQTDRGDLLWAIYHHYPGRLSELRNKYKVRISQKQHLRDHPEVIEKAYQDFMKENGFQKPPTFAQIKEAGRNDLVYMIGLYPGKYSVLKNNLGFSVAKKVRGESSIKGWTETEDNLLKEMLEKGKKFREIACELKRSRSSVKSRAHRVISKKEKQNDFDFTADIEDFMDYWRNRFPQDHLEMLDDEYPEEIKKLLKAYEKALEQGQQISFEEFVRQA